MKYFILLITLVASLGIAEAGLVKWSAKGVKFAAVKTFKVAKATPSAVAKASKASAKAAKKVVW